MKEQKYQDLRNDILIYEIQQTLMQLYFDGIFH